MRLVIARDNPVVYVDSSQKGELDDAMYMALINDRPDFVQLFLENGLSLKDFLTLRVMIKLYNEVSFVTKARGILHHQAIL